MNNTLNGAVKPEVKPASYEEIVRLAYLDQNGNFQEQSVVADLEGALNHPLLAPESRLTWTDLFKRAVVSVKHSEGILKPEDEHHIFRPRVEIFRSDRLLSADQTRYAMSGKRDAMIFETADNILRSDGLTPYMQYWMGRMAMQADNWRTELDQFLPLMPNSPQSQDELRESLAVRI